MKSISIPIPKPDFHNLAPKDYPTHAKTTPEEMLDYFRDMATIRRMELISDVYYKEKKIFGFCHLYDGQEGCGLGIARGLTFEDPIISGY